MDGVCRLDDAATGTDADGVGERLGVRRVDEAGGAVLYSEELGHLMAVEYSLVVSTCSIGVACELRMSGDAETDSVRMVGIDMDPTELMGVEGASSAV
jgi:hypothetical protein